MPEISYNSLLQVSIMPGQSALFDSASRDNSSEITSRIAGRQIKNVCERKQAPSQRPSEFPSSFLCLVLLLPGNKSLLSVGIVILTNGSWLLFSTGLSWSLLSLELLSSEDKQLSLMSVLEVSLSVADDNGSDDVVVDVELELFSSLILAQMTSGCPSDPHPTQRRNVKTDYLLDMVSSQGLQDHFRAKSANWLAGYTDCQPRFQFPESRLGRNPGTRLRLF